MIPVNYEPKFDPHFGLGKHAPEHADIFVVYAKVKRIRSYRRRKFIVALPPQYTYEDTQKVMLDVMSRVLQPQDTYTFDDLDWDTYISNLDMPKLPILSYNPQDEDSFFWLLPPKELRH